MWRRDPACAFKARRLDAKTSTYKINTKLGDRPSGCIVWLGWARRAGTNRVDVEYRWYGGRPGDRLPDLGDVVAKHSKGNSKGQKLVRPGIRVLSLSEFTRLDGAADLLDQLFGPHRD